MITCTLGEKRYSVDFISGRALREMGPAWDMYARLSAVAADAVTGKVARQAKGRWRSAHRDGGSRRPGEVVLSGVRKPVQPGRRVRPLPRGPVDARRRASAAGGADPDHRSLERIPYTGSAGGDGILTLPDYIFATYNELLGAGWRMNDIDNMDMLGFFRVRAWEVSRTKAVKAPKRRYIDEVWPENR